jgi:uncharacterized membrane protein YfcA
MTDLLHLHDFLALASGGAVGFTLGLIGGGGSILAVPLLVYVVGVADTHIAIGTAAAAVAANALSNLVAHGCARTVKWRCALFFAGFGIVGAAAGSTLGKLTDGDVLLALFGAAMVVVGTAMLRRKAGGDDPDVMLTRDTALRLAPRLAGGGIVVGGLSGFFGIGGGFLVVPGLVVATAMPMLNAVGSSLVSVTAFGATTAANYALDSMVDWRLFAVFVVGGIGGGIGGTLLARRLGPQGTLKTIFSLIVIAVGCYVAGRGVLTLF